MTAGASALREARRADLRVAEYERRLVEERQRAASFRIAGRTEAELAARLRAMSDWGWVLLEDRRWPGTRDANIDLIMVGPGGVLIVDVKSWSEPDIVEGHLYRGEACADDEVDKLRRQADLVSDEAAALGLAPGEIIPVMVFMNQRGTDTALGRVRILDENSIVAWAVRRGARLNDIQIAALVRSLEAAFPSHDGAARTTPPSTVIPEPVLPVGRHQEPEQEMLFDATSLEAALVAGMQLAPIEEWMTFLHPDQVRLVRRIGSGPARIRGGAGTGKTVVALHRAALLAESMPGPVLFTTFVKTLPPVLESLCVRLSPASAGRIEFTNLHAWAMRFLAARERRVRVDRREADVALNRAWGRIGKRSCLAEVGAPWEYWKDEIEHVIKGRGLTDFDDYANLRRVGRRTRLTAAHREVVWSIYADYETQLREAGVCDFTDLLSMALVELRESPLATPYCAVMADEVQDLNCQAVRLLGELAGPAQQLLLVGDGQQQIYPGGYTLAEAGVSITGRSAVLRVNYRNGAEILASAADVVSEDEYDDLEGAAEQGRREIATARSGGTVRRVSARDVDELRALAVTQTRDLVHVTGDPGGIAILCATNAEVDRYLTLLLAAGVRAIRLASYTGVSVAAVKVGTVQRAKGLEFKHVVYPMPSRKGYGKQSEDAIREAREREHRTQFVAMTRARDSVWVGQLA